MIASIGFYKVAVLTASCPLFSLFLCLLISILYHFESSTSTHCKVFNFLPSLSACFGSENPEKIIWSIGIACHIGPRLYIGYLYKQFYMQSNKANTFVKQSRNEPIKLLCMFNFCLYYTELISLILLTFITSSDNHGAHACAFTIFIFSSILYMKSTCLIFDSFANHLCSHNEYFKSIKLKKRLTNLNILFFILAIYFYYRHNTFCEPYVYTAFALSEYIVVITNILFHGTAIYDFDDYNLVFLPCKDVPVIKW